MPYDYSSIMTAQAERIAADQARAAADLEAARLAEDPDATMYHAGRILELDAQRDALAVRANNFVSQQSAQPQRHPSGLSDEEIAVAKASHSGGTADQRIQEYAQNKARYQHLRATGQYRDDQGTVRR
jgi:hypothetical protein